MAASLAHLACCDRALYRGLRTALVNQLAAENEALRRQNQTLRQQCATSLRTLRHAISLYDELYNMFMRRRAFEMLRG